MTTLAELADYVRAVHDETLSDQEGMVYMIWQDFEITLQKSGELLWQRGMHTIHYGITGVNHEMPVAYGSKHVLMPYGTNKSFAYVPENTIEYIKTALANIKKQEQPIGEPVRELDLPEIIEKYKLELRTEGTKAIIRVPDETMVPPYIKGLIFNQDYNVVCPGVIMPEDITTPEHFDYEAGAVDTIEEAFDGVLFRIYFDGETGTWAASTNGQIKAKNGWGGRAFDDLFHDPAVQTCLDYSRLNPAYCYYVVLEHPEHINIVPHFKARLILVDAVTISQPFTPVPIADIDGFAHVQIRQALTGPSLFELTGPSLFELAEHYKIGIVVHLTSGRRVRIESANFKYLSSLRPNIADVYKQWIHKLHRPSYGWTVPDLLTASEQDIVEYLKYFTWHTEKFNYMRQRFLEIYTALCQKITERKVIIPKRLMKFYRELTPEEQMPDMVLRKLIDADEKHLFYLMNPYNVSDENRDPQ